MPQYEKEALSVTDTARCDPLVPVARVDPRGAYLRLEGRHVERWLHFGRVHELHAIVPTMARAKFRKALNSAVPRHQQLSCFPLPPHRRCAGGDGANHKSKRPAHQNIRQHRLSVSRRLLVPLRGVRHRVRGQDLQIEVACNTLSKVSRFDPFAD